LKIIRNPLVILLATLSAVSYGTGDARAGTVMAAMVALSVVLRFFQEARADVAAEKLTAMIHVTATVIRDGDSREMPLRDLVPGDIISLSAGDMIPGDVRVLSSKDLFVSQGSLTGESLPVEKFHDPETNVVSSPTELKTRALWAQASKAARRPRLWSLRGSILISAAWPDQSRRTGRRQASTKASIDSRG
jgi:P-type Mg2+ transporter